MKPAGNPWMKFYPSDWRADPALRSCTIAARGLWVEMICIMHEAVPYGSLLIAGARIDKKRLAVLAGISERDCSALLLELEGCAVFSRDDDGTIYSRRMRRDHEKADEGRRQIAKRWGDKDRSPNRSPIRSPIPETAGAPNTQKPEARIDMIGSAGASQFSEGSKALASAFWKALGFERPIDIPPEFAGVDWRAVNWESAGWTVDLIETEARKVGPDKPLTYHEKCFATAFAKRQAPLPIVEIKQAERLTVIHGTSKTKPGGSLIASIHDELARSIEEDRRLAGDGDPVLCLSARPVH